MTSLMLDMLKDILFNLEVTLTMIYVALCILIEK